MLDLMRRHSQSWLIYCFFGVIIVVFVFFFGPQSEGCVPSRTAAVATIGEVEVDSVQLEQLYGRIYQRESRGAVVAVPPPIRKRALAEDIVLVYLLAREAREAGLDVSDEQLAAYVQGPRNMDRGYYYDERSDTFDQERYELGVPGTFGIPIPEYEEFKAAELLAIEFMGLLEESIAVPPAEIENLHQLRTTEYVLEYIELDPRDFNDYFEVPASAVQEVLATDEQRVRTYFDDHVEQYQEERHLRFSRILIQIDLDGGDDAEAAARTQFDEALAAITENPDSFGDVAQTYSSSPEAVEGGDLGWKPATNYSLFSGLDDLDAIEAGEVVTYESETSLIIYRLTEERPAVTPDFNDIREQIAMEMLTIEQGDLPFQELAERLHDAAQTAESLGAAIEAVSNEYDGVPTVTEEEGDEGDETDEETDEESVDPPVRLTELVEVEETAPFSIDRPDPYAQFGGQFIIAGGGPPDPEEIPGLGTVPRLARQLTGLSEDNPVAPEVYPIDEKLLIVRFISATSSDEPIEEEQYQELREELRSDRAKYLFGDWQTRLLVHQQGNLGPYLQHLLNTGIQEGLVTFEEAYFRYEPETEVEGEDPGEEAGI